jgi:DNA-binding response OmpR family regulator
MVNLLIVDDSTDLTDMIAQIYSRRKFLISNAKSKEEIFSYLERIIPDLIFLDVILEDEDGREICKQLKSIAAYRKIPVILMSGSPEKLIEYKEFLADDIMEKPFNMETILSKARTYLGSRKS